jgi:hypothetical protein
MRATVDADALIHLHLDLLGSGSFLEDLTRLSVGSIVFEHTSARP